jgi:hypothetical protein
MIIALAATGTVTGAELAFAHYAPGAGEVRIQVDDDTPRMLRYRGTGTLEPHAAGTRRLRATNSDGRILTETELPLRADDRYFVMLAGDGSDATPFQFRVSADHNVPLTNQRSLQHVNLAIANGPVQIEETCGVRPQTSTEAFGTGSASAANPRQGNSNLHLSAQVACNFRLLVSGEPRATLSLIGEPGERLRRIAIGDGENEPYELRLEVQERRIESALLPSPAIEGLWYPVGAPPGTSLQLSYDAGQPAGHRVSGLLLGYDANGEPTWRVLESELRLVEYRGGNPDGTQATLPVRQSRLDLVVHSCGEITLVPKGGSEVLADGIFEFPRHALRLTKLFPPGCPGTFRGD